MPTFAEFADQFLKWVKLNLSKATVKLPRVNIDRLKQFYRGKLINEIGGDPGSAGGSLGAYGERHPEEIRECAEVPFVAGEKSEHKKTEPLRYVGIRIRKRHGGLFEGGLATRHFALVSNIWDWKAGRLMEWHRENAGTIEAVHDVVKRTVKRTLEH